MLAHIGVYAEGPVPRKTSAAGDLASADSTVDLSPPEAAAGNLAPPFTQIAARAVDIVK
jgi:hypothetical protein